MKRYDVACPVCNHMNRHLFLEETNGWLECERCKQSVQILAYAKKIKLPVYTGKWLAEQPVLQQ